eukprot:COSAG05_NODE_85_length_20698_cov_35.370309_3_plen_190_part_00
MRRSSSHGRGGRARGIAHFLPGGVFKIFRIDWVRRVVGGGWFELGAASVRMCVLALLSDIATAANRADGHLTFDRVYSRNGHKQKVMAEWPTRCDSLHRYSRRSLEVGRSQMHLGGLSAVEIESGRTPLDALYMTEPILSQRQVPADVGEILERHRFLRQLVDDQRRWHARGRAARAAVYIWGSSWGES